MDPAEKKRKEGGESERLDGRGRQRTGELSKVQTDVTQENTAYNF